MKHITLFIILFTITCLGQSKYGNNLLTRDSLYDYLGVPANTNPYKYGSALSWLNDYEDYEAECFADSSKKSIHKTNGTSCIIALNDTTFEFTDKLPQKAKCLNKGHRNKIFYTHREPTFTGFMDFLVKKYGKE
jgi:hypothetical protein